MGFNIVRTDSTDPFKVKLSLGIHLVGKGKLNCNDSRVNKNHAQLDVLKDKIVIKPLTKKPCFIKKKGAVDHEAVHSDSTVTLNVGDQFGFLPDCYWYKFIPVNGDIDVSDTTTDTIENNVNSSTKSIETYILTTTVKIEPPDSPISTDEDTESSTDTNMLKRRLQSGDNIETDVAKKIKVEVETENLEASDGNADQKPDSTVTVFVKSEVGEDCETENPVEHWHNVAAPPFVHSTETTEDVYNRTAIKMEPRTRTSSEQFSMILEFMERHGDLTKSHPNIRERIIMDQMWQELSDALNSIGSGVPKSAEKWKKVWADWKTKTKKKAIVVRRGCTRLSLTPFEERLLRIMAAKSVSHADVEEQESDRSTQSTVHSESSSTENANEHVTNGATRTNRTDVKAEPTDDVDPLMYKEMQTDNLENESINEVMIKREHDESTDVHAQTHTKDNAKPAVVKSKVQSKQTSKVESTRRRSVKRKTNTTEEPGTSSSPRNISIGGIESIQDPLMNVQMVMDIDKPEVEDIALLPIKREDDEYSDEYDPRETKKNKESTIKSNDNKNSIDATKKRVSAKGRTAAPKPNKRNSKAQSAKVNEEPGTKKARRWSYYSDSQMPESPEDPYGDSDSDEWQPKLNVAYMKKIGSAIEKNKPFWVCPENFYED